MKKQLRILMAALFAMTLVVCTSCSVEEERPMYELRFTCTSNNPYLVEVDGTSHVVSGNSFRDYILEQGTYAWKVTQQSGYLLVPTVEEGTVNLDQDKEIVFP